VGDTFRTQGKTTCLYQFSYQLWCLFLRSHIQKTLILNTGRPVKQGYFPVFITSLNSNCLLYHSFYTVSLDIIYFPSQTLIVSASNGYLHISSTLKFSHKNTMTNTDQIIFSYHQLQYIKYLHDSSFILFSDGQYSIVWWDWSVTACNTTVGFLLKSIQIHPLQWTIINELHEILNPLL
jgi:hypothetical protein